MATLHEYVRRRDDADYTYRTIILLSLAAFITSYVGSEVFFVGTAWFAIESRFVPLAMIGGITGLLATALGLIFERLQDISPPHLVRRMQILIVAMMVFGSTGPIAGFAFGDFAWKMAYQSIVPLMMLLTVIAYLLVRESVARRRSIDVHYGVLLLAILITVTVFGLIMGKNWLDIKPPPQILQLSSLIPLAYYVAIMAVFIFLIPNLTHPYSVIRFTFFRQRNVVIAFILNTISAITTLLIIWVLIAIYQAPIPYGYGYNNFEVGLAFVPGAILFFGGVAISLLFISKVGAKRMIYTGAMATIFGSGVLMFVAEPVSAVISFSAIAGAGAGVLLVAGDRLIKSSVLPSVFPSANAFKTISHCIGAALGCLIGDSITMTFVSWQLVGKFNGIPIFKALPAPEVHEVAFLVLAILGIAAFVLGFLSKALSKDVILHNTKENLIH